MTPWTVSVQTVRVESVTGIEGQYRPLSDVQVGDTRFRVQADSDQIDVGEPGRIQRYGGMCSTKVCFQDRCYLLAEENP